MYDTWYLHANWLVHNIYAVCSLFIFLAPSCCELFRRPIVSTLTFILLLLVMRQRRSYLSIARYSQKLLNKPHMWAYTCRVVTITIHAGELENISPGCYMQSGYRLSKSASQLGKFSNVKYSSSHIILHRTRIFILLVCIYIYTVSIQLHWSMTWNYTLYIEDCPDWVFICYEDTTYTCSSHFHVITRQVYISLL